MEAVMEAPVAILDAEPTYIGNEASYEAALKQINDYLNRMKGDETLLSDDEHRHFRSLALGIEGFEKEHYPVPTRQEALLEGFEVGTWDSAQLRAFREEFDFSDKEIAELLGMETLEIVAMERGEYTFSRFTAIALTHLEKYVRYAIHGQKYLAE